MWDFEQEYLGGNQVDLLSNCLYPAERIAYRNDFFMIHKDGYCPADRMVPLRNAHSLSLVDDRESALLHTESMGIVPKKMRTS